MLCGLGTVNPLNPNVKCSLCSTNNNLKKLLESSSYFLTFPLKDQIKTLLETHIRNNLQWNRNDDDNTISDVISGKMYKQLKSKHMDKFTMEY